MDTLLAVVLGSRTHSRRFPAMSIKPFVSFVFACVAAVALVLVTADSSHAIKMCKVKVDKKTGLIQVDATGLAGPSDWAAGPLFEEQ